MSVRAARLVLAGLLAAPGSAIGAAGGPDTYGYTYIDSSEPGGPSFTWTGGGSEVFPAEDGSVAVSLPFSFDLYGASYTQVHVGDDGLLTFGGPSPGPDNACLPGASLPIVAAYWDDWKSDEGEVRTRTTGSTPNRVFTITWDGVEHDDTEGEAAFQVKLFEGTTAIELHYDDADIGGGGPNYGGTATVGVEDPGAGALQLSCNAASLSNGYAVRFEVTCFDGDGDGFWDCIDDCDDADPNAWPGAPESCGDGIDQDCDGSDVPFDADGDSYLAAACGGNDCDDADAAVNPGAYDACDGVDQDCSGAPDDGDLDGDTWDACADCDEGDAAIHPGAVDVADDGIDQDCNGVDATACLQDLDLDGLGSAVSFTASDGDCLDPGEAAPADGGDCDDGDASVFPGAIEVPDDGVDQDCDSVDATSCFEDLDGDSFGSAVTVLAGDGDCADPGESAASGDCDDANPATWPGAPEACDGVDSDCDGSLVDGFSDTDGDGAPDCVDGDDDGDSFGDGVDCLPLDPTAYPGAPEACDGVDSDCDGDLVDGFGDTDGDGIPDCAETDSDGDGYEGSVDCDDADPTINPGETDVPDDGIDQDCSGADTVSCLADDDGDGWGSVDVALAPGGSCADAGLATSAGDCDDTDAGAFPGAPEILDDGIDQDCDGADTVACFADDDGDGVGSSASSPSSDGDCDDPGEAAVSGDCDDSDPAVFPDAVEACDVTDSDCDGDLVDEFTDGDGDGTPDCVDPDADADGDGYSAADDCDDGDANVHPGATEIIDDGVDQDCNGSDVVTCWSDLDGDGFGGEDVGLAPDGNCGAFEDATAAGGDCDDDDPAIHPDAEELCDGIDGDCDGQPLPGEDVDADEDGWLACADCDDQDELIHPDAEEACDGLDSDCDGAIPLDETIDVDGDEIPECGDCDDEDPDAGQLFPEECVGGEDEDCDGLVDELDEDCDGLIDGDTDGWCADGVDLDGDGDCSGEDEAFSDPGELGDCDDEDAAVHPGADELCNGIDDDCDPATGRDEEDLDGDGFAGCDGDCDDGDPAAWPGADEACSDEVDQDCDGSESLDLPDPDCWAAACTDCAGSVPGRAKGGQGPAAALLLLVITLVGRSRRRRTRGTAGPAAAAGLGVVLFGASALAQSPADPDVVRGLVDAGRCDEARTAALPWAAAAPDDPDAWRALGDAERCLGHERAAVLAYRRFLQAGGADPAIETVLQGLADRLGTLEVGLTPGLPRAPVVRIEVGDEVLTPTAEGEAYRFADLPSAVPLAIRVAGLGFAPTEATIEPLAPGEVRRVDSGADWRGLGGLQLSAPLPQGSTAVVLRPGETEQVLSVDEPVPVTAIDVSIRLTTVLGSTEATAPVDDGEVTAFDPGPWLPASLRIVGLPAGASVRVYVESPLGASVTRTVELPGTAGEIDPGTGLRLAPPIVLDSLIGGTGGVFVTHAVLGGEVTSVVIEPGAANAATFEAESLAGAAAVRERWLAWSDHRADLQQRTQRGPLIFGLIAGGSATVAAILVGGASGSGREATGARQLAIQATGTGDLDAIPAAWEAHGDAAVRERGLLTAAGVLTGVAVTSAGLTLTFGLRGQRARAELGAWEPWEAPP